MSKIISIVTLSIAGLEKTYVANLLKKNEKPINPIYDDYGDLVACENDSISKISAEVLKTPDKVQKNLYRKLLTQYLKNKDEYKKKMEEIFMKHVNDEEFTEEELMFEVDMIMLSHLTAMYSNRHDANVISATMLGAICFCGLFNKSFRFFKEDKANAIMYYDNVEGFGFLDEPTAHGHFKHVRSILRKDPEMVKGNGMKISTLKNLYLVRAATYEVKMQDWIPENLIAEAPKRVHMLIIETDPKEHTAYTEEYKSLKFVMPDITTSTFPDKTFSYIMFRSRKARDDMLRWIVKDTNADVWIDKLDSM